jgi:hypothetical protein
VACFVTEGELDPGDLSELLELAREALEIRLLEPAILVRIVTSAAADRAREAEYTPVPEHERRICAGCEGRTAIETRPEQFLFFSMHPPSLRVDLELSRHREIRHSHAATCGRPPQSD